MRKNSTESIGLIFIHGGQHGGWCWDRVRERLLHPSLAVDLPRSVGGDQRVGTGGDAFLAHAEAAVDATPWDRVVLVAHSLGGVTACRLAERSNKIVHAVFVACMIPRHGGRPIDDVPWYARPISEWGARSARRHGTFGLPTPLAKFLFCNDLSKRDSKDLLGRLCPETAQVLVEPFTAIVPDDVSRTWIQPLRDRALPRRLQQRYIERIGADDVVNINAGHEVMISRPAEVADVLNRIAAEPRIRH